MRTRVLVLAAASAIAITGGALLLTADRTRPPQLSFSSVPDVARVVCDEDGTRVLTPIVRPQPDGVYLTVLNRADARQIQLHHIRHTESEHGSAVGEQLQPGLNSRTQGWSIEPGELVVACLPTGHDAFWEVPNATLTVVDPEGLWVPTEVECFTRVVHGHSGIEGDLYGLSPDEARIAFDPFVAGLHDDDRIVSPGYSDTPWAVPFYVVVRDGVVVAELYALRDLNLTTCAGSGIDVVRP